MGSEGHLKMVEGYVDFLEKRVILKSAGKSKEEEEEEKKEEEQNSTVYEGAARYVDLLHQLAKRLLRLSNVGRDGKGQNVGIFIQKTLDRVLGFFMALAFFEPPSS